MLPASYTGFRMDSSTSYTAFLRELDTLMLPVPRVAQTFTQVGHYKIRLLLRVGLNFTQVTHFFIAFPRVAQCFPRVAQCHLQLFFNVFF